MANGSARTRAEILPCHGFAPRGSRVACETLLRQTQLQNAEAILEEKKQQKRNCMAFHGAWAGAPAAIRGDLRNPSVATGSERTRAEILPYHAMVFRAHRITNFTWNVVVSNANGRRESKCEKRETGRHRGISWCAGRLPNGSQVPLSRPQHGNWERKDASRKPFHTMPWDSAPLASQISRETL